MNSTSHFVFLFLLFVSSSVSAGERTYNIGVASWVGWSFVHVAQQQGFFEEAGVKVDVKWYREPEAIEKAFAKDEIDFRLDFVATVLDEFLNGQGVTLLAETNWSHGGDKVIGKRGVNIANRKGATIGVYRDSPALIYFLSVYLKKQGLRLNDYKVRIMPLEQLSEAFIKNELSFAVVFDPYTIDIVKRGGGAVKANSSQFPGCMPEGIYAKKVVLDGIPKKDQVAIMGAFIEASEWTTQSDNWPRFRHILNTNVLPDHSDFSDKELRAMLRFVKIHNGKVLHHRNREKGGLYKYLQSLRIFLKRNGRLKYDFEIEDLFDSSAMITALEASN